VLRQRGRGGAAKSGAIALFVIATIVAFVWASWAHFDWVSYPSPPRPDPSGPRQSSELVVVETVGGVRNRWRGAYRHRVALPSGEKAYVTTTEVLPRGEHILAEFTQRAHGELVLFAYRRCGLVKCDAQHGEE
jgi:hypothetical protein